MGLQDFLELKQEFINASTPETDELQGHYAVRLVTGFLPGIRFFSHRKFFPDDVALKRGGYNEFLGRIRIGNFKIEPAKSILGDGQQVMRVNYNGPGNPFWLRPLNDELKKVREGYYLGRGIYIVAGRAFNTFYFSLEPE